MNRLNEKKFDPNFIYPSNHDAVLSILDTYFVDKIDENNENKKADKQQLSRAVSQISQIQVDLSDSPV